MMINLNQLVKYKKTKDVEEYIKDFLELRHLYNTKKYDEMIKHINKLMDKHIYETSV